MKIELTKAILASLAASLIIPLLSFAQELPIGSSMPGMVKGTGANFEIIDSQYLNIFLQSTEEITATLESIPKTISIFVESSTSADSIILTIGNLEPNKTYYKFQDSYKNEDVFVSDSQGRYTWTQDLIQHHHIWFQEIGGTVFLPQDCSNYGIWDKFNSTCTLTRDLTQSVEIMANNITLNCSSYSIIGKGAGYGIYLNNREGVIIQNCAVINFSVGIPLLFAFDNTVITSTTSDNHYGIVLAGSFSNTLTDNNALNNWAGIVLNPNSDNNILADNNTSDNFGFGIVLQINSDNVLTNNTASNNNIGIHLYRSSGNVLRDNTMSANTYNFGVFGISLSDYIQDIDTSNKVDGKPIYYWVDQQNRQVPDDAGYVSIVNSTNITVKDLTLGKNLEGIMLAFSNNSRVENVNSLNNNIGIYFFSSSNNTITNSTATNNMAIGIYLALSHHNTIAVNTLSNNRDWSIRLDSSSNNALTNNKASGSFGIGRGGAYLENNSDNNILVDNNILNNTHGIFLYGFGVNYPDNNKIYHNNFINNLIQAHTLYGGVGNLFDNGYPSGGNYWSDYDTLAEGCFDNNSDGICDRPYFFIRGQDRYPFMQESGWKKKEVPLYTQVKSPLPFRSEEEEWADLEYAKGFTETYDCGSRIRQCGCAITSVVMVARYYDVTNAQGNDVNPGAINQWLKNEPGGYQNGDVNWIAAAKYTNWRIKYEKTDKTTNNYTLLNEYLNKGQPVIAKENAGRGGINRQHFLVIDGKLTSTYSVKDPAWYNTKTLNEITNTINNIRGYENGFDGLKIYKKGDGIAQAAIAIALGSPAELLITDSQNRKLGKDVNGIEYQEIPDAWYFEDGFDDPTEEIPPSQERNKLIQILEPVGGEYQIQVIGTGEGSYSIQSNSYDIQGNVNHKEFNSETAPGFTAQYNLSFNSSNSASTTVELFDEVPPEAEIYFDLETKKLKIKGTDNTTVNPAVSIIEKDDKEEVIYEIEDEAGNITKLYFDKIKQEGKEIKAELDSLQYNDEEIIKLPKTELKYEWSINKKTNQIKELEQKIQIEGKFEIRAKYNHQNNETEIKIKREGQKEEKLTLPGFIIVKLATQLGKLSYELPAFSQVISAKNQSPRFFYLASLADSFIGKLVSFLIERIKDITTKILQFPRQYSVKKNAKEMKKNRPPCLGDDETASHLIKKKEKEVSMADIIIYDKNTSQEKHGFQIELPIPDHYHPIEIHSCGVYAVKDFNYDFFTRRALPGYRLELWRYQYTGNGESLILLSDIPISGAGFGTDFRVSSNEKYIVLEWSYFGKDDYSLIIKDLNTKEDVFSLLAKEIFERYPNIVGNFNMREWSKDSRYFWGDIFDGAYVLAYFRIDAQNWKYDIYEAPDGAMGGFPLNINTGYVPIQPGQVWTGDYQLTQELKEQYRKEGRKSELYLYNLFTKEKISIETNDEPLFSFKPKWPSDTELQYELPTGEKKIYKINDL